MNIIPITFWPLSIACMVVSLYQHLPGWSNWPWLIVVLYTQQILGLTFQALWLESYWNVVNYNVRFLTVIATIIVKPENGTGN